MMTSPLTKAGPPPRIVAPAEPPTPVRSQVELAELLADEGVDVTQATLSRDLVELDAVRSARRRTAR